MVHNYDIYQRMASFCASLSSASQIWSCCMNLEHNVSLDILLQGALSYNSSRACPSRQRFVQLPVNVYWPQILLYLFWCHQLLYLLLLYALDLLFFFFKSFDTWINIIFLQIYYGSLYGHYSWLHEHATWYAVVKSQCFDFHQHCCCWFCSISQL